MADWTLHLGDCRDALPTLASGSFDACVCDPPYPMIRRSYGMLSEAEWWALMCAVVPEVRRVLKPKGSAVFILQPNSECVGRMRTWLWDFLAWVGREWGVVQDVYWWNHETLPKTKNDPNLLRPSLKTCVWVGPQDCYRDGLAVLWEESQANRAARLAGRCTARLQSRCSRVTVRDARARAACGRRGGVTPFNVVPVGADAKDGKHKHPGRTPLLVADWWTRYIVPPGGAVLDPFAGSGTVGVAALRRGCTFVGIEKEPEYVEVARKRLAEAQGPLFTAAAGG